MSGSRWGITPSWLSGWLWYWAHPINNRKNTANVIYIIKKLTWANKKWDYTGGPASFTISSYFNYKSEIKEENTLFKTEKGYDFPLLILKKEGHGRAGSFQERQTPSRGGSASNPNVLEMDSSLESSDKCPIQLLSGAWNLQQRIQLNHFWTCDKQKCEIMNGYWVRSLRLWYFAM